MALRFVGIDPGTDSENCPSVWVDDADGSIVIQGWEITDPAELAQVRQRSPLPEHEKVIRIPRRMTPLLLEACGDGAADELR